MDREPFQTKILVDKIQFSGGNGYADEFQNYACQGAFAWFVGDGRSKY